MNAYKKKDIKKIARSIVQLFILLWVAWLILGTMISFKKYEPDEAAFAAAQEDHGFIAISYISIDEFGSENMLSLAQLQQQLDTLRKNGYVTISQKDIIDYYAGEKLLPENALFLMFEDGRKDSAIFAQRVLEKNNFIGSMLSYAENLDQQGSRLLNGNDLRELQKDTFWEMGTNGYRLAYINVFDRYDDFIGELTSKEFVTLSNYLDGNYNHYLMDYLRDADQVPEESMRQMQARIREDYAEMLRIYKQELNEIPSLYALMHANTGRFGTVEDTSNVNEEMIKSLFRMNFNRVGAALNMRESSNVYDLTRVQPLAYWSVNHLVTHVQRDVPKPLVFFSGESKVYEQWDVLQGALECTTPSIILTSTYEGTGKARLHGELPADLRIETILAGNKLGTQGIILRAREDAWVSVEVKNNHLLVRQKQAVQNEEILFDLDLDIHDGVKHLTIAEDRARISKAVQGTVGGFQKDLSVENADTFYIPPISLRERARRELIITAQGNELHVAIDGKDAVSLDILVVDEGELYLYSANGEEALEDRNLEDPVYDAIFNELMVMDSLKEEVIFSCRSSWWDKTVTGLQDVMHLIRNWFNSFG